MMNPEQIEGSVGSFLDLAVKSEGPAAIRLALGLLDAGASSEQVIVDLLAASQRETGERWMRNDWSVADEHIVSGVTQRSLDAIANSERPRSVEGSVVVACAEGDWHALPAQMCAEVLRFHGFSVSFLGASTPSEHVARLLARDRPDALVVTCNLALFFGGVSRLVEAAHLTDTPVIAGGRALTSGPSRALRLGADGWAPDCAGAVEVIRSWVLNRPAVTHEPVVLDSLAMQLDLDSASFADAAFESLHASNPRMNDFDVQQRERTREDLVYIVRYIAASMIVEDPTVLNEFLDWLLVVLRARNVPEVALVAGIEAIAPIIGNTYPDAGRLARDALDYLKARKSSEVNATKDL